VLVRNLEQLALRSRNSRRPGGRIAGRFLIGHRERDWFLTLGRGKEIIETMNAELP